MNGILELRLRHQHAMELRQTIERNTRVEVMLDVVVDVFRRNEDVLEYGRAGGSRLRVSARVAVDSGMFGDAADAEDHDEPGEQRNDPVHQQQMKCAEPGEACKHRRVEAISNNQETSAHSGVLGQQ